MLTFLIFRFPVPVAVAELSKALEDPAVTIHPSFEKSARITNYFAPSDINAEDDIFLLPHGLALLFRLLLAVTVPSLLWLLMLMHRYSWWNSPIIMQITKSRR